MQTVVFDPPCFAVTDGDEESTHDPSSPDQQNGVPLHTNHCHELKVKWLY